MSEYLASLFSIFLPMQLMREFLIVVGTWVRSIRWDALIRLLSCALLGLGLILFVLYLNDKVFEHYWNRRRKIHHLTIRNLGNTPSIFLLRVVSLPRQLTIRFTVGGSPMIITTQKKKETSAPEKQQSREPEPASAENGKRTSNNSGELIPDLSDPWKQMDNTKEAVQKTAGTAKKTAMEAAKTSGLMASILGTISTLLPFGNKAMKTGQEALKGFQQDTNQAVTLVSNKVNNVDTLKKQTGKLASKVPDMAKIKADELFTAEDDLDEEESAKHNIGQLRDFIYDEDAWRKSIDKKDESGRELNYAQSRILEPGDSMKIDVEIRNRSGNLSPVSLLYKIEIWQVPQTNLNLAAPRQTVSGVVAYPAISPFEQFIPAVAVIIATILAAIMMACFCHMLY